MRTGPPWYLEPELAGDGFALGRALRRNPIARAERKRNMGISFGVLHLRSHDDSQSSPEGGDSGIIADRRDHQQQEKQFQDDQHQHRDSVPSELLGNQRPKARHSLADWLVRLDRYT